MWPGQQELLLWKVLSDASQFINKFVLAEVEVGEVGELITVDKFVERVYMNNEDGQEPNNQKVLPFDSLGSE